MTAGEVRIEPWEDGAAFHVKAHAGARRQGMPGIHDGMLRVEVQAAPERGKANQAIAKLLARELNIPAAAIELLSGETQTKKRFGVHGVKPESLRERFKQVYQ